MILPLCILYAAGTLAVPKLSGQESAAFIMLAASILVFRTFRERFLLIWIFGWLAYGLSLWFGVDSAAFTTSLELQAVSQGAFVLVPPGVNERATTASGLILCRCEDRTQATAAIAGRWHDARERRAFELQKEEGREWFARRQRFLAMTAKLAATGRLSRFLYVAERATS